MEDRQRLYSPPLSSQDYWTCAARNQNNTHYSHFCQYSVGGTLELCINRLAASQSERDLCVSIKEPVAVATVGIDRWSMKSAERQQKDDGLMLSKKNALQAKIFLSTWSTFKICHIIINNMVFLPFYSNDGITIILYLDISHLLNHKVNVIIVFYQTHKVYLFCVALCFTLFDWYSHCTYHIHAWFVFISMT